MALRKINTLAFLLLFLFLFPGCGANFSHKNDEFSTSFFSGKSAEIDLREQMLRDVFYQDSVIREINAELDQIEDQYIIFESNIEQNVMDDNRARIIIDRIRQLKIRIDDLTADLHSSKLDNQGLLEMISRLKKDLAEKEETILLLRKQVKDQETIIDKQEEEIHTLEAVRERKSKEIEIIEEELRTIKATAYIDLADLLYEISQNFPEIRGLFTRRTETEAKSFQESLIKDALKYYNKATLNGNQYADRKAQELKTNYPFLQ